MNTTYMQRLAADEARIEEETPFADMVSAVARAGRYSGTAHYYAHCADFEAAQRQRLSRDPRALIACFCDQIGGPTALDIATLLTELDNYLRLRPELNDVKFNVCAAADEAKAAAEREAERQEIEGETLRELERAEEQRERRIDDDLIGRSILNPVSA